MTDHWKNPLREIRHHFTTALLIASMLVLDFAPVVVLFGLMMASEWLVRDQHWFVLGTPFEEIVNHIEVFLWIAFMGLGAVKILVRLGYSVLEMGKLKNMP
ncbi:hypothetical protein [Bradyrhizobium commune]|uniref:Uncharacterized protein n=1 Tax=Bradyrhizobium commune TaxID=83627 RepID=A0A7S9CZP0_9BRAD|nr:hypothetical protein [Bradyrhizobium commune]QPF88477.1 hypothetical protein IC761_18165 [Bradyrhizobium commune]